jgi:peptidyl-prolyl cis-trans isomerase B (cyclophilin B)
VAGKKRERELQRQRYQRARTRERQHAARRRRTNTIVGAVVAVLVVAGGASYAGVALSGGGTAKKTAASATSSSANPTPSSSTEAFSGHCTYTPEKDAQHAKNVGLPPSKVSDPSRQRATIETNRGTISATLLGKQAPCTVNSFSFLASKNFFDGTPCHRLTTKSIFVLQCGDPSGTGAGGPGYGFANENLDAFTGKSGS